jgi:hypothetical protein
MKHMPVSESTLALCPALKAMSAPSASRKSAAPHLLDTLRLPCFATGTPAAATTKAVTVEILKV